MTSLASQWTQSASAWKHLAAAPTPLRCPLCPQRWDDSQSATQQPKPNLPITFCFFLLWHQKWWPGGKALTKVRLRRHISQEFGHLFYEIHVMNQSVGQRQLLMDSGKSQGTTKICSAQILFRAVFRNMCLKLHFSLVSFFFTLTRYPAKTLSLMQVSTQFNHISWNSKYVGVFNCFCPLLCPIILPPVVCTSSG